MTGLKVLGLFALLLVAWPASSSARGLLANPEAELGSASSCNTCLFALRLVDDVLADPEVVTSVVNLVDTKVCPRLGPKCHNLAEGLIPVIIQWAKAPATAYQFCRATGSCRASDKPAELAAQRSLRLRDDSAQCITCRMVVGQAQKVLNDTTVLDRLNVTLQQACQMLPAEIAGTCLEMVSTYEPLLVALIAHASPKDICELLAMCEHDLLSALLLGGSVLHHQQQRVLRGSVPAQLSTSQARRGAAGHSMVLQPGSRQPQLLGAAEQLDLPLGDSCDMCKMAVIEMHSLVGNPSVQAQLINYTKNICDAYPSFADTCKLYVDTYAPVVFSIMEQYLVPDTLCVQIGVCHPPPAAAGMMMPLQASQQHMPCHHGIGGMLRQVVSRAVSYMRMGLGFKVQADQVVMQHTMIMGGMMQPEQEDEQPQGAAA